MKWFWQRMRMESDMDEELRFHIDSYAADLMKKGLAEEEALRRARLEFGALEARKEECRESVGLRLWDELRSDLRSGMRILRNSPMFTAVAVLSLALGIGANTAVFTLANEVLFKTLAVPNSDRLRLFTVAQGPKAHIGRVAGEFPKNENGERVAATFPYPLYQEMLRRNSVMEDVAGFKDSYRVTASVDGDVEPVDVAMISGNFYRTLDISVETGRAIVPSDDTEGVGAVAVISDSYWSTRFGRSTAVLGKTIRLNSVPFTVVGVNDPEFKGPRSGRPPQVFFPIHWQQSVVPDAGGSLLTNRTMWWLYLIGRLKPGVSNATASAAMTTEFRNACHITMPERREVDIPRFVLASGSRGLEWGVNPMAKPVYLLLCASGVVLLIACVNLANLLLARATARQREISLRLALGAARSRIIRQILTESLLLAFAGGAVGLLLGYTARNALPNLLANARGAEMIDAQMDWRVFGFAFLTTALTGLLFGMVPAWRCTQAESNAALKQTARMSTSRPSVLFGKALVVFQIALSLLLVVAAGLFVRTLLNLRHSPTGMDTSQIVLFDVNLPRSRYTPTQRILLFQRIADGLAALPGVQKATSSGSPMLAGSGDSDCYRTEKHRADFTTNAVGAEFFSTFSVPILSGRSLNGHDNLQAPRVAVVNKALADAFFRGRDPVGQTIAFCDMNLKPLEIVGLSGDAKYTDIRGNPPPTVYIPFAQFEESELMSMTFEVKTVSTVTSIAPGLREVVKAADQDLPVLDLRTQTEQIDITLSTERTFAMLTSGFGIVAVILASIGIYGVMAYTVSRRTNEIGIRMALGAESSRVLKMVLGETSLLAVAGIVLGLAGALGTTRVLTSMLFGVKATDPATFVCGAALLLFVALLAALVPAWRAASVEPMSALRHE